MPHRYTLKLTQDDAEQLHDLMAWVRDEYAQREAETMEDGEEPDVERAWQTFAERMRVRLERNLRRHDTSEVLRDPPCLCINDDPKRPRCPRHAALAR